MSFLATAALTALAVAINFEEAQAQVIQSDCGMIVLIEFGDDQMATLQMNASGDVTAIQMRAHSGGALAQAMIQNGYDLDTASIDEVGMVDFRVADIDVSLGELTEMSPQLGALIADTLADQSNVERSTVSSSIASAAAADLPGLLRHGLSAVVEIAAKIAALAKVVVASIIAPPPRQMATAT
jgi:hypothetical protein